MIDLYSAPPSATKYSMSRISSLKTSSNLPLFSPTLQTLVQVKKGNILYLASQTRSDFLYFTTQLSRRSNKATQKDMAVADRLLR